MRGYAASSRTGAGPPLLALHGFTGSAATWTPLAAHLARDVEIIAPDLLGHGASDAPADPARYALARAAEDLWALLDAHEIGRVALLGYSMGGRLALHVALARPAQVAALVLESTSPGIASDAERRARIESDERLADDIERDDVVAFVDRWERLPLWDSQAALSSDARAALREQRLRNSARGLANSLRGAGAGAAPSVLDRLPALTTPVLLIAGALDAKYVGLAHDMAARLPAARVAVVPGVGHAVHLERPDAFAEIVGGFLRGRRGASGGWR